MGVKATPAGAAAAWNTGFSGATQKYTDGVNSVQTAPGQAAAAQKNLYLANVQQAADRWANNTAAVTLQEWKTAATTTGASRLASGATKGQPKMQAFMQNFLPKLSTIVDGLPARGSFDQNLARFTNYAQQLHQQKGQFT